MCRRIGEYISLEQIISGREGVGLIYKYNIKELNLNRIDSMSTTAVGNPRECKISLTV